jgi:hypothetical protein
MTTLTLKAECKLEAAAAGKPRRFSAAPAYSGGLLPGYTLSPSQSEDYVVDLKTLQPRNDRIIANLDHDTTKRVGHVTRVENDCKALSLFGDVSGATAAAAEFVESSDLGLPWSVSIECALPKPRLEKNVTVNGQHYESVYVARNVKLTGLAFCTAGADPTAVGIAASKGGNNMNETTNNENENPIEFEKRRIDRIEAACKGGDMIWGDQAEQVETLRAAAVAGTITEDALQSELLKSLRASRTASGKICPRARDGNGDGTQVLEAALCQSIGLPELDKAFDDQTLQAAHTRYRGRLGLQQLLLMAAAESGYPAQPGERINDGNLRQILRYAFAPSMMLRATGISTINISNILANTANKSLLQGWKEGDTTWREIAMVKPASDFKPHTSHRLLDHLEYDELPPDGQIKHGKLSDEVYTRQVKTYAKMLGITRVDIVNDDLGSFDDIRVLIGRAGLTKFNKIFWATFLNNGSFFTAGNGNYIDGSPGSVLGTDGVGLQAGVLAFRKLQSANGITIDGEPTILLVPPELEFNARRLYQSTNIGVAGVSDTQVPTVNIFGGLYRPIVQNRLSNSAFTGYSATAWYLLRPATIAGVVTVSFLNGEQNPMVESADMDFDQLGIQFRGVLDFGVDLTNEYLAGIKSKGAA